MVDVRRIGQAGQCGLPAKTLETKAGRAAVKPLYFGSFYPKSQTPTPRSPKDFALRAACAFQPNLICAGTAKTADLVAVSDIDRRTKFGHDCAI